MSFTKLLLMGLVLLVAAPASAGFWERTRGEGLTQDKCTYAVRRTISYGDSYTCWHDFTVTGTSNPIETHLCENMDLFVFGNLADDTDFGNAVQVYAMGTETIDASDNGALLLLNATLTGDPAAAGDLSALNGFNAPTELYLRVQVLAGTVRVGMSCHP